MKFRTNSNDFRELTFTDWAEDTLKVEVGHQRVYISTDDGASVSFTFKQFAKLARKVSAEIEAQEAGAA